MMHRAG